MRQSYIKVTKMCDICGKEFSVDEGYAAGICWHVTGHAYVQAFNCPEELSAQHWGCTPEHVVEALQKCLVEHMHPHLLKRHTEENNRIAQNGLGQL